MVAMEAAVLSSAVSIILKTVSDKLAPLLIKKYSSIMGVHKDLQELQHQVEEINCWLETEREKAMEDASLINWLKRLKDVAYNVDDAVYEFQLMAEKYDSDDGGMVFKYLHRKSASLTFQCKIKAIKKRFAKIVKQRIDFSTVTKSLPISPPVCHTGNTFANVPTSPIVDVASVIGRNQEKQYIISKLVENNDQQKIKIISIIGLGGSGKTRLAEVVFIDGVTHDYFEVRPWVHVSQQFHVENLDKKLFECIAGNDPEAHDVPYMSKRILEELTGKRFLLVLDDVWTDSQIRWEEFMVHLKTGAPGSGILLTTRNRKVSEAAESTDQFHIPFLSPDDSWRLFQQTLGVPAKGLEAEFVEVGKEIVKKCGGVPLAIKVLSSALYDKKHIEQWQAMRDNNILNDEGEEYRTSACLWLSYLHLPSHLKQCLTICSVFPKGYMIDKEKMIDLWIAHNMIPAMDGVDYLEDIGYAYFNSLVQMSFLQDVDANYGDRIKCRMHDLAHDLARTILDDEISLDVAKKSTKSTKHIRYFSLVNEPRNLPLGNLFGKARTLYVDVFNHQRFGDVKEWKNNWQ